MRRHRPITMIFGCLLAVLVSACTSGSLGNSLPPIAFIRGVNDVYLLYGNGTTRYVTTGQGVSWAPGHKDLLVQVVTNSSPPSVEVWLVATNGKRIRQVTSVYPDQVRFFAAGEYRSTPFLAYATDKNGIQLRNLLTGAQRSIPVGAAIDSLTISPGGTRIAFVVDPVQHSIPITLYTAGTYNQTRMKAVLPASEYRIISAPSWSPDGQWIAAVITANKGAGYYASAVWLMHPDGKDLHLLTMGSNPQWSPDGQWISYIGQSGLRDALFEIHPDGTGRKQLTPYIDSSSLSAVDISSQPSW